jgi:hypothetical protein
LGCSRTGGIARLQSFPDLGQSCRGPGYSVRDLQLKLRRPAPGRRSGLERAAGLRGRGRLSRILAGVHSAMAISAYGIDLGVHLCLRQTLCVGSLPWARMERDLCLRHRFGRTPLPTADIMRGISAVGTDGARSLPTAEVWAYTSAYSRHYAWDLCRGHGWGAISAYGRHYAWDLCRGA